MRRSKPARWNAQPLEDACPGDVWAVRTHSSSKDTSSVTFSHTLHLSMIPRHRGVSPGSAPTSPVKEASDHEEIRVAVSSQPIMITQRFPWWRRTGSNRRPHACKARALPTELRPREGMSAGVVVPRLSAHAGDGHLGYGGPGRI